MANPPSQSTNRDAFRLYLIITFGITWLLWGISLALNQPKSYVMPAPGNIVHLFKNGFENSEHALISILFALATYGPFFGAIIAIRAEKGKEGLKALWKTIFSFSFSWVWFIRMLVVSFVIAGLPFLLAVITGLMPNPEEILGSLLPLFIPVFVWQLLSSGLGEEPGWRGYLLRKLQGRLEGNKPIWALGLIWAVWHYPFTIYWTLLGRSGEETVAILVILISSLAGFTISIIGMTYLHVWLFNNTGSVLLAILFHAFNNTFPTILSMESVPQLAVVLGIMPWVVVFFLERRLGKENFPGPIKARI